jgi:hypothetical protein
MGQRFEPIACSLPLRDAAKQAGEWTDLHNRIVRFESKDGRYVVEYPIAIAEEVENLVAREASCCAWLTISTSRQSETIRLELESENPDARPVIEALIGI